MIFYAESYAWAPKALRRYRREIIRSLAGVSLGTGALALIGGTVTVIGLMTTFAGLEMGLQGYTQLNNVGVQSLAGFVAAYVVTREGAPLMAGMALVATVGAGFTAQLGAMRVSEEIDALEVMAVPSVPFLVTTRLIAGVLAIVPLFGVALIVCYQSAKSVVTIGNGQPTGTYDHYFNVFLIPEDVLISLAKVLAMAVVVMSVHCYYGYTATGGPAGVGKAVGRAVRLSLVLIMVVDLGLSLLLYGNSNTLHLSS
jgi:phospholipid/cholesterol/gamma-HCH transport system permease protein